MSKKYHLHLIAKRQKPLCSSKYGLITYSKFSIYIYDGSSFSRVYKFKNTLLDSIKSCFRISERIFRLDPQSAACWNNFLFVARHSSIEVIDLEKKQLVNTYRFREKYIHTSRFSVIKGISGFRDCVVYGEYFPNKKRERVSLYGYSDEDKDFIELYSFSPGRVRHIHNVISDKQNDCVYILTGDEDAESGIWKATDDFKKVVPVLVGSQEFRSCIASVNNEKLLFATDVPSKKNYFCEYSLDQKQVVNKYEISGSCTSGCEWNDNLLICSSVETHEPSNRGGWEMFKYYFTNKLAEGILDNYARVYLWTRGNLSEILKEKKDHWPAGVARFGRFIPFYDEYAKVVYIYPIALKKIDGNLYRLEKEDEKC